MISSSLLLVALAAAPTFIPQSIPEVERLLRNPPPTVDGRLGLAYVLGRTEEVEAGVLHPVLSNGVTATTVVLSLELAGPPRASDAVSLERVGCALHRLPSGGLANVGRFVTATCRWAELPRLATHPLVRRIEPMLGPSVVPSVPASTTAREIEAVQLRQGLPRSGGGAGVLVADFDSGVDPFHPFLFRADGGGYDWLDRDGDGRFEPGIDCVDFNRNGRIDPGERLLLLKAPVMDLAVARPTANERDPFVPGVDWLFQDENEDGTRNQGSQPPYGDTKPTFGEQLYVADDVNQNGLLDVGERVIALKTPKVRVALGYGPGQGLGDSPMTAYRRGGDLSALPEHYPFPEGFTDHGTLIAGTIAGGAPTFGRYVGVAPEADVAVATRLPTNLIDLLAWAESEHASIVNWELADFFNTYLDGSTNVEQSCDVATGDGLLQVATAGNLGGTRRHRARVEPTGASSIAVAVPAAFTRSVYLSFLWRGAPLSQLSFTVEANGVSVPLTPGPGTAPLGANKVRWGSATSQRGTALVALVVSAPLGQRLAGQTLTVQLQNGGAAVEVQGFVQDDASPWGPGVSFTEALTDRGTYASPATSDTTLAVGSYRLDDPLPGAARGDLAAHSSQGPRLNGGDGIDLTAPEDQVSSFRLPGDALGLMAVGSGTSNAAPMVSAAAALLKALDPAASPATLASRLLAGSVADQATGPVPSDAWGHGKLRAFRAAVGQPPVAAVVPSAAGTAQRRGDTLVLDASQSRGTPGEALSVRWDLDYDGVAETGPFDLGARTIVAPGNLGKRVVLEVANVQGEWSRALVPVDELPQAPADAGAVDAGADGGLPDAGPQVDGGAVGAGQPPPTGCGCTATVDPLMAVAMVGFALASRRRRWR